MLPGSEMTRFDGTVDELAEIVRGCGYKVACSDLGGHKQLRTTDGAVVDFYDESPKRRVVFRGSPAARAKLEAALGPQLEGYAARPGVPGAQPVFGPGPLPKGADPQRDKVFLVHGHDTTAREQLELVLHQLGLDPFVLANTEGAGLTIIEALEAEMGTGDDQAKFGIVLLTPDDVGYALAEGTDKAQPRARQNVVLEMGMLFSALGRGRVAILRRADLEVPSDAQGILYIGFNYHVRETVPKLVDRLIKAGLNLSSAAITKASS